MNSVHLIGRFTKKPELNYTTSSMAITKFTLAVDRAGKDKGADFIRVTAFDKQAENICRFMDKGRQIAIEGHIKTGEYEKDGQKVYTQDVICDRAEFIGRHNDTEPRSNKESYHNYGGYSEAPEYKRFEEPLF